MNKIDLRALTLAGTTGTSPVLDPLAVLRLDNRLFRCYSLVAGQNTQHRRHSKMLMMCHFIQQHIWTAFSHCVMQNYDSFIFSPKFVTSLEVPSENFTISDATIIF